MRARSSGSGKLPHFHCGAQHMPRTRNVCASAHVRMCTHTHTHTHTHTLTHSLTHRGRARNHIHCTRTHVRIHGERPTHSLALSHTHNRDLSPYKCNRRERCGSSQDDRVGAFRLSQNTHVHTHTHTYAPQSHWRGRSHIHCTHTHIRTTITLVWTQPHTLHTHTHIFTYIEPRDPPT